MGSNRKEQHSPCKCSAAYMPAACIKAANAQAASYTQATRQVSSK